ncbi:hypothetical protein MLD38_031069 [Melastoma candidum]|uniref:Uncharacterized protein n=1 Tax=Melastoma candidum TaxID=119954 RepID=A0ACB9MMY8_9MYRT|nr:hypothetical protein MLD38_031069 [Melastoma candidum]
MGALFIFTIVFGFQLLPRFLSPSITQEEDEEIRREIKELLKQASSLSQPSTFAEAAKLKRLAASKEQQLLRKQESAAQENIDPHYSQLRILLIIKVVTYFLLVCWFWRTPVASIPRSLVQPFGKLLSWGTQSPLSDYVMDKSKAKNRGLDRQYVY